MSSQDLLSVIEEQIALEFTGKVNVLDAGNKQILGEAHIYEGEFIYFRYQEGLGHKALVAFLLDEVDGKKCSFVVEPEIIPNDLKNIHFGMKKLKDKMTDAITKTLQNRKLRPPSHLKIYANASAIDVKLSYSEQEFWVLTAITEYNKVEDVYKYCRLMEYEITNALVSLRTKNALTVIMPKV